MQCSVIGCKSNTVSSTMGYFTFPDEPDLKREWLNAIGRPGWEPSSVSVLCSSHFTEDSYEFTSIGMMLKSTALPKIVDHSAMLSQVLGNMTACSVDEPGYWLNTENSTQALVVVSAASFNLPSKRIHTKGKKRKQKVEADEVVEHQDLSLAEIIKEFNSTALTKHHLHMLASKPGRKEDDIKLLQSKGYVVRLNNENDVGNNHCENNDACLSDDSAGADARVASSSPHPIVDLEVLNRPEAKQAIYQALHNVITDDNSDDYYIIITDDIEPGAAASDKREGGNSKTGMRRQRRTALVTELAPVSENIEIRLLSRWEQLQRIKDGLRSEEFLKNPHRCYYCGVSFKVEFHYNQHVIRHDKTRGKWECDVCNAFYVTRNSLLRHQHNDHRQQFRCKLCGFETKSREKARLHNCESEKPSPVTCDICDVTLSSTKVLYGHRQRKHKSDDCICYICKAKFTTAKGLEVHLRICRKKVVQCPECPRKFRDAHELRLHQRTGAHRRPSNTVAGVPDLYCAECNIQFKTKYTYAVHMNQSKRHANPNDFKFKCDKCPKAFVRKLNFEDHLQTHKNQGFYECHKCHKTLKHHSSYWQHMRWAHSGGRPRNHVCTYCGRTYESNAKLMIHNRTHTNEKPFECEFCGKTFISGALLREHVRGVHLKTLPKRIRKTKPLEVHPDVPCTETMVNGITVGSQSQESEGAYQVSVIYQSL